MTPPAPLTHAYFDALELVQAALDSGALRDRDGRRFAQLEPRAVPTGESRAALVELRNDDGVALALITCDALALADLLLLAAAAAGAALPDDVRLVAPSFDGAHAWIAGFARRYGATFALQRAQLTEGRRGWRLRLAPGGTIGRHVTNPHDRRLARLY